MTLFGLLLAFIVIAVALAWFLISHDKGEKEPVGALWIAAAFGLLGGLAAAYLEIHLLPTQKLQPGAALPGMLVAGLGVGVVEEACKFIPLALFIYRKQYFNEHTDGVIYFALAGLGFGLPENLLYTLQFGAQTGVARVVLTPFFHAATTGMVGYFLAKRKLAHQSAWGIWPVLLAAMILHGLYDFGLVSGVALYTIGALTITLSLSALLFVLFMKASTLDQEFGLSIVGRNNFCRSCGFANPAHHLYCTRCGKNA